MTMEVLELEEMKNLYVEDIDFVETWKTSKEPWSYNKAPHLDYFIQQRILFKNHQLYIPS